MAAPKIRVQNLLFLPYLIIRSILLLAAQKRFIKRKIEPVLGDFKKRNDGTIDEADFRKITHYYGLGVPAVLGAFFSTIRGFKLNTKERWAATAQGAITGLFDDFFDKRTLSENEMHTMIHNPEKIVGKNLNEELFLFFYKEVLNNTDNRKELLSFFQAVFEAQIESVDQEEKCLSAEEITAVTFKKGGKSVLFYRMLLSPLPNKLEQDALYSAGALMQLGNDIFDVYKDAPDNIDTLATTAKDLEELRLIYLEKQDEVFSLFHKLPIPKRKLKYLCHLFSFGMSRCLVALDQFEGLASTTSGRFIPNEYTRDQLVCDMEKPRNILRSIHYYLRYKCF